MDPVVAQYSNKVVESLSEGIIQLKLLLGNEKWSIAHKHLPGIRSSSNYIFLSTYNHLMKGNYEASSGSLTCANSKGEGHLGGGGGLTKLP